MQILKDHLRLQLALIRHHETSVPYLPPDVAKAQLAEIRAMVCPTNKDIWTGSYVYVLELEDHKFYVGMSKNLPDRLSSHFSGAGALWTKQFHPRRVVQVCTGDCKDERRLTLEYMKTYGWQNVRGSGWCRVEMMHPPPELAHSSIGSSAQSPEGEIDIGGNGSIDGTCAMGGTYEVDGTNLSKSAGKANRTAMDDLFLDITPK